MNPSLGEVNTSTGLAGKVFYPFHLSGEQDEKRVRGEITVPADSAVRRRVERDFMCKSLNTPIYKELLVRLHLDNGTDIPNISSTPRTTPSGFPCICRTAKARCELSGSPNTRPSTKKAAIILSFGTAVCFSIPVTTPIWKSVPAKYQNEVFLLKAFPGNLYQHPTTGVGLIDFLHGNFENNNLAARLQSEFKGDNMVIINAYMDSVTGELLLETEEKEEQHG